MIYAKLCCEYLCTFCCKFLSLTNKLRKPFLLIWICETDLGPSFKKSHHNIGVPSPILYTMTGSALNGKTILKRESQPASPNKWSCPVFVSCIHFRPMSDQTGSSPSYKSDSDRGHPKSNLRRSWTRLREPLPAAQSREVQW